MDFISRLKFDLKANQIPPARLAKVAGVSKQWLDNLLKGRIKKFTPKVYQFMLFLRENISDSYDIRPEQYLISVKKINQGGILNDEDTDILRRGRKND